jgi:hypothetical protein
MTTQGREVQMIHYAKILSGASRKEIGAIISVLKYLRRTTAMKGG